MKCKKATIKKATIKKGDNQKATIKNASKAKSAYDKNYKNVVMILIG